MCYFLFHVFILRGLPALDGLLLHGAMRVSGRLYKLNSRRLKWADSTPASCSLLDVVDVGLEWLKMSFLASARQAIAQVSYTAGISNREGLCMEWWCNEGAAADSGAV